MDKTEAIIIYHKADNDGVFAGAIADYYVRHMQDTEDNHYDGYVRLYPMDYGDQIVTEQDVKEWKEMSDTLIIVDFSFPPEIMKAIYETFGKGVIWLDHHKPAIETSVVHGYDAMNGIRSHHTSALMLAYQYFFDPIGEHIINGTEPDLFRYLAAWDSFSYHDQGLTLESVHNVNTGTEYEYGLDFTKVSNIVEEILTEWDDNPHYRWGHDEMVSVLACNGETINKNEQCVWERMIKEYGDLDWTLDGHKAVALFSQQKTSSLCFASLKDTETVKGIVFKRKKNGGWRVNAYNINEEDEHHVGKYLAERYNGGGHRGAAGCEVDDATFMKLLETKCM